MKNLFNYIKLTIVGGALLLIPLFVLVAVIVKAGSLVKRIVTPIAHRLPFQIPGIAKETLLAILVLLLLCFLAGIFMHTGIAQRFKKLLEEDILVHIPGYSYLQALSIDKLTNSHSSTWKPATVQIDGNEVICFVIDETEHYCSIFFPSAPIPSSGTVCAREKQDVRYLSISVSEAIAILRQLGKGSAAALEKIKP
ncbi:hypothetical protein [Chitinophaga sp.]|uniref:hypothetical protein n=1 Tax=Chitinophaga sp. TaxID=1869181 RepID=UPI002B70A9E2|nr:hypothetical protein [Chitinophaga sp.]HWV65079.1 hypothetical protein [Chitinophaga sp.]